MSFTIENVFLNYGSSLSDSCLSTSWHQNWPYVRPNPGTKKEKETRNRSLKMSQNPNFLAKKEGQPDYNTEKYLPNEMILIPVLNSENLVIFSNEKITIERVKFPILCPIQENQVIWKFCPRMSHVNPWKPTPSSSGGKYLSCLLYI